MNAGHINFTTPFGSYSVPNRWELLTPELYLEVCRLLDLYAHGKISYGQMLLAYTCKALDIDPGKIKGTTAHENIYLISSQVDFIMRDTQHINNCFLAQLLPTVNAGGKTYHGYDVCTGFDTLTCSLTAIQFIEAYELVGAPEEKLPLLAAILYCPDGYTSEKAHALASAFNGIGSVMLQGIALNFQAFCNYLFTRTPFKILYEANPKKASKAITIAMAESLYNLSADGLGDVVVIEQMPVIKYLSILRKKLIESVRSMHEAKMDVVEIAAKTGLSIQLINKMI